MINTTTEPRIYVACLAAYNAGFLNGRWMDASSDLDEMWEEINAMLKESQKILLKNDAIFKHDVCEEWAIHDYEGFHIKITEYAGLKGIASYMEAKENSHDDENFEALIKFAEDMGHADDLDTAQGYFDNAFCGIWDSFRDYADDYVESTGLISNTNQTLQKYFDYKSFARDLKCNYNTYELDSGSVAIFYNY
jgi:antirestriction protein